MRTLAIDFGKKRIGLAVSDPLGIIAQSLPFLPFTNEIQFVADIRRVVEEKGVALILMGHPRNMSGTLGPMAAECERMAALLERDLKIKTKLVDETLTSWEAGNLLDQNSNLSHAERKGVKDSMSAAILLQEYLDAQKGSAHG